MSESPKPPPRNAGEAFAQIRENTKELREKLNKQLEPAKKQVREAGKRVREQVLDQVVPKTFDLKIPCVHRGCTAEGVMTVRHKPGTNVYGVIRLDDGWFQAFFGYSSLVTVGLCPDHRTFMLEAEGQPTLSIVATEDRMRGLVFKISEKGVGEIGSVTFPNRELTFAPGDVSDAVRAAGERVAAALDYRKS